MNKQCLIKSKEMHNYEAGRDSANTGKNKVYEGRTYEKDNSYSVGVICPHIFVYVCCAGTITNGEIRR